MTWSWATTTRGWWTSITGAPTAPYQAGTIAGLSQITAVHAADLDNNNLLELIGARGNFGVSILRSFGSRAFGDPLSYSDGPLFDVAVADVNGDGLRDLLGSVPYCELWTWMGTGLGTLSKYWRAGPALNECFFTGKSDVAIGDFDADGRNDAVLLVTDSVSKGYLILSRNLCGDGSLKVTTLPVVTTSQPVTVDLALEAPAGVSTETLIPTAPISIVRGSTTLATAHFSNSWKVTVPLIGLTAGVYSLAAVYPGDEQYDPIQAPFTIKVTNETTPIVFEADPAQGVFGMTSTIKATVAPADGGTPTGTLQIKLDGVNPSFSTVEGTAPTVSFHPGIYPVGTNTFTATYSGDGTYPPSTATFSYEVVKSTPGFTTNQQSAPAGQAVQVRVSLTRKGVDYAPKPAGTLTVREGTATYLSTTVSSFSPSASFQMPPLPEGRHELRLSYGGDGNYNATETIVTFLVFPAGAMALDARGTAEHVAVRWTSPAPNWVFRRKKPADSWAFSGGLCCPPGTVFDTFPEPEQVYLYRMEGPGGAVGPLDVAMRISFTDDPLMAPKGIKAVHLQEIVRAANILRAGAGLPAISLSATAGGKVLTAAQLSTLRDGINAARTTLGAASFSFTGAVPGTVINAAQLQELREAIR